MRALTIRQPWAAAIAHGPKRIENRSRPIPKKHLGATILIHAGLAEDKNALPTDMVAQWPQHRGSLIAVARLAACHHDDHCCRPWGFPGTWHWELADVRPLTTPVKATGQLGLWTPSPAALATVQAQLQPQEA